VTQDNRPAEVAQAEADGAEAAPRQCAELIVGGHRSKSRKR